MDSVIILVILLMCFLFPIGLVFGIAYYAAQSRKKKQEALLKTIPSHIEFSALVRYNRGSQQGKFLKIKAFEGSGILYVDNQKICFKGTMGFFHEFNLKDAKITWEGENLVNGLLKWFSIQEGSEKLFFNVESGLFIFHTKEGKLTTRNIYDKLVMAQIGAQ